jgi:hypothetical protein
VTADVLFLYRREILFMKSQILAALQMFILIRTSWTRVAAVGKS